MYCNYCGKVIQDDAAVCAYCGIRVGASVARKRLVRPRQGRSIAGVCLGFAEYFDIDVTVVRLVWLITSLHDRNWLALLPNRLDRDAGRASVADGANGRATRDESLVSRLMQRIAIQQIKSGDAEITYRVLGEGPPVVLLHPFPANHEFWLPVARGSGHALSRRSP